MKSRDFDLLFYKVEQKDNIKLMPSNVFRLTYNSFELFMILSELQSFLLHLKKQQGLFSSSEDGLEVVAEQFTSLLKMYDTFDRYCAALTKDTE